MFSFLPGLAEQLTRQVETVEQARAAVAELDRERVDLVKLVLEPGFEDRPLPRLREELFRAAMAEAKARKMRTTVHVGTDADARLALDAGADGIEHAARGLSDTTIAMMAARKATFTPTNVVVDFAWKRRVVGGEDALARRLAIPAILQTLLDPESPIAPFLRQGEPPTRLAQAFAGSIDQTSRAIRAGVPILAGSDAGNPVTFHGVSLIRELELLAQAGMPLGDVLKSATSRAGRSPRPVHARAHLRRRGGRSRGARSRSHRARRGLPAGGLGVSRRPEARTPAASPRRRRDRGVPVYAEARMARWPFTPLRQFGWETYAWLIYSLPYLFSSFDPRLSALETSAMLAGYVVFLGLYLAGQLVRGWRILWIVAGLDLLAIVFCPHNPGAATFFIYGSALLGGSLPPRRAAIALAVQVLAGRRAMAALGMPWWYYAMLAVISTLIGAVTIQAAARTAADAKLRLAQAEVERLAKLAERERIARDLHDVLGHTLSVVVLKSELAQKLLAADPARAGKRWAKSSASRATGWPRSAQAITGYRSSGLAAEIEHVRDTLVEAGIDATAVIDAGSMPLARRPGNRVVAGVAGGGDQRHPPRRRDAVPYPLLRAGWLRPDGSRGQRARRRSAVRQRPHGHARAHPGARRRAAPREATTAPAPDQAAAYEANAVIRVLIAEDQGMVLGALAALLEIEADIEVVARARDGREALALAARTDPDVVLTDIEMPHMTGLEMAAELHAHAEGGTPARHHPDHLRAPRLPAARARRRRVGLPAQGRPRRKTGGRDPRRPSGPARRRSAAGAGRVERGRPAHRSRTPGAPRLGRRTGERRDRPAPEPVRGHGPQLPLRIHRQARRHQPHRSRAPRPPARLAVDRIPDR